MARKKLIKSHYTYKKHVESVNTSDHPYTCFIIVRYKGVKLIAANQRLLKIRTPLQPSVYDSAISLFVRDLHFRKSLAKKVKRQPFYGKVNGKLLFYVFIYLIYVLVYSEKCMGIQMHDKMWYDVCCSINAPLNLSCFSVKNFINYLVML